MPVAKITLPLKTFKILPLNINKVGLIKIGTQSIWAFDKLNNHDRAQFSLIFMFSV